MEALQKLEIKDSLFTPQDFLKFRSIGNINKYRKKETIILPESPYRYIYMICKGMVKVYRLSKRGKEKIIRILKMYDMFGEYAVLGNCMSSESVEAMEDSEVLLINVNEFRQMLMDEPELANKFTRMILERNLELENHLSEIVFRDVDLRAIRNLVELAKNHGVRTSQGILIDFKITQYELGNIIGATRETTSTVLNNLKREGMIDFNSRKILITDIEQMLAILRKEEEATKEVRKKA